MTLIFEDTPLFLGNQSGIASVKPDNYTIVGNPTITGEGIQNISTENPYNNYVKTSAITFGSTFDVNVGFTVNSISSPCRIFGETNSLLRVFAGDSSLDVRFEASNGNTIILGSQVNLGTIVQHFVTVNVAFTGTSYILKIYKDGVLAYTNTVNSTLLPRYTSINTQGTNTNTPQNYSIDLNALKIYVDGSLVYQACLKIPYTLNEYGLKIPDSRYKDRVIEAYEQGLIEVYFK